MLYDSPKIVDFRIETGDLDIYSKIFAQYPAISLNCGYWNRIICYMPKSPVFCIKSGWNLGITEQKNCIYQNSIARSSRANATHHQKQKNSKNHIDKSSNQDYSKSTRRRANLISSGSFIPSIQNEQKISREKIHV